jgi:hypothetical protein
MTKPRKHRPEAVSRKEFAAAGLRPRIDPSGEAQRAVGIRLPPHLIAKANFLGEGSTTEGIRIALDRVRLPKKEYETEGEGA